MRFAMVLEDKKKCYWTWLSSLREVGVGSRGQSDVSVVNLYWWGEALLSFRLGGVS